MAEAKEIKLNDNDTGLKVFVNGDPDTRQPYRFFSETIIAVVNRKSDNDIYTV